MNCHPSKRALLAQLVVGARYGMSASGPAFWREVAAVEAELERDADAARSLSLGATPPATAGAPVVRTAEEQAVLTPALCRRLRELGMTEDDFLRYHFQPAAAAVTKDAAKASEALNARERRIVASIGLTEAERAYASKAGTESPSRGDVGPPPRTSDEITESQRRLNRRLGLSDEAFLKGSATERWTGAW